MSKTQQIKDLEWEIKARGYEIDMLNAQLDTEAGVVEMLTEQATADEKLYKRLSDQEKARHAAEKKAATEAATLKHIANGFVPIEVLRRLVREEYKTTHNSSFTKTDLTVMLDNKHAVDKALLAAVLEKPITHNFANGGFTNPSPFSPFKPGDKVSILKPSVDPGSIWLVRGVA